MKKILIYAVAGIVAAGTAACSGGNKEKSGENPQTETRNIKLESYTYDLIGEYAGSDSALYDVPGGRYVRYVGQGVLPEDIGEADVRHLRDTLMKIALVRFADADHPEPVTTDSIRVTGLQANDSVACGEVISNLSTTLVTPRVVVWENEIYTYPCMAAHGMTNTSYVNFCLTDGKIMTLDDLLKPGYEKKLAAMIAKKVRETGVQLLVDPKDIPVADQFEVTTKGLLFSYDPYQIAPYSEGTVQVEIETHELAPLLSAHGSFVLTGVAD